MTFGVAQGSATRLNHKPPYIPPKSVSSTFIHCRLTSRFIPFPYKKTNPRIYQFLHYVTEWCFLLFCCCCCLCCCFLWNCLLYALSGNIILLGKMPQEYSLEIKLSTFIKASNTYIQTNTTPPETVLLHPNYSLGCWHFPLICFSTIFALYINQGNTPTMQSQ